MAISFIFANSEELEVSTDKYSVWCSSAAYGDDDLRCPDTVVMTYTGHTDYTKNDPRTFVVVGENDGIISWRTMQNPPPVQTDDEEVSDSEMSNFTINKLTVQI